MAGLSARLLLFPALNRDPLVHLGSDGVGTDPIGLDILPRGHDQNLAGGGEVLGRLLKHGQRGIGKELPGSANRTVWTPELQRAPQEIYPASAEKSVPTTA